MLFSLERLLISCVHDDLTFTNRLASKKVRGILARLLKTLVKYSSYTYEQLRRKDKHFRFIVKKNERDFIISKLTKYHSEKKKLALLLKVSQICQLSLGDEEERVIGILQQINNSQKHPERNYLFWPLHLDFEHAVHPNLRKKKLADMELVCIIKEEDCNWHFFTHP